MEVLAAAGSSCEGMDAACALADVPGTAIAAGRSSGEKSELRHDLLMLLRGDEEERPKMIDSAWVTQAVGAPHRLDISSLERAHAVHGCGSILNTGQSISAEILATDEATGQQVGIYIKKIQASRFAHQKSAQDLRRDLASCHNECAFYQHISPLMQNSVTIPRCYYVAERNFHDYPDEAQMSQSEYMLVLESMTQGNNGHRSSQASLCQHSPLTRDEALHSLSLIARFHAWAWNDPTRLGLVAEKLLSRASYWDLPRRGAAEMERMPAVWVDFLANMRGTSAHAAELLSQPGVVALADRMLSLGPWINEEIHGEASRRWHTIVHGDFKAMNVFVPIEPATHQLSTRAASSAALIDFQWTGVGLGMLDVAMHLYHGVELAAMEDGGEEELISWYHRQLTALLSDEEASGYPIEVARRHYALCLLDYGRVVMSKFWAGLSPESLAAKAGKQNCSMVYRQADAALRFVRRMEQCISVLEAERRS